MRRIIVALATLCLLAGQLVFAGVASGADPSPVHGDPADPGLDLRRGQVNVRFDRQDRPGAARAGPTPRRST